MDKIVINLYDILVCFSNAQDLVSPVLSNHHQQVAYLSFRLSECIDLPANQQEDIFLAALIHDIGALSTKEKLELIEGEPIDVNNHGFRGAKLFEGFNPLQNSANIIKYHHLPWNNGEGNTFMGEDVPFGSHIIHLADRVCALIGSKHNIITQVPHILSTIKKSVNTIFEPRLVDALSELCKKEYIWLDLISSSPIRKISNINFSNIITLEIDDIVNIALIFSQMIDFRSRFTSRHSAGVAKTAEKLACLMGFSPYECKMMLVAGYLHDIGKIAISDEILEKSSKLSDTEINQMRGHTYYTYRILEPLEQLKTINTWASFHHEKLDGTGYPFHIPGENLSIGSRIMAVADIFTALTENRPYREGMDFENTQKILRSMVKNGAIDGKVVDILIDNFNELNLIRKNAQLKAANMYESFLSL